MNESLLAKSKQACNVYAFVHASLNPLKTEKVFEEDMKMTLQLTKLIGWTRYIKFKNSLSKSKKNRVNWEAKKMTRMNNVRKSGINNVRVGIALEYF